jgi:hypothetical protein
MTDHGPQSHRDTEIRNARAATFAKLERAFGSAGGLRCRPTRVAGFATKREPIVVWCRSCFVASPATPPLRGAAEHCERASVAL